MAHNGKDEKDLRPMRKLAELRKAKGYTQGELAYMCGLRDDTVSQYERGVRFPNGKTLSKLARALGCTIDELDEYRNEPLNALCAPRGGKAGDLSGKAFPALAEASNE